MAETEHFAKYWAALNEARRSCGFPDFSQGAAQWAYEHAQRDVVAQLKAQTRLEAQAREAAEKLAQARAYRKAKKLAAEWGVEIEKHDDLDSQPWYVDHKVFRDQDDDPHQGDHYVHYWSEVLSRVEDYVAALQAKGLTAEQAATHQRKEA